MSRPKRSPKPATLKVDIPVSPIGPGPIRTLISIEELDGLVRQLRAAAGALAEALAQVAVLMPRPGPVFEVPRRKKR